MYIYCNCKCVQFGSVFFYFLIAGKIVRNYDIHSNNLTKKKDLLSVQEDHFLALQAN